MMETCFAIYFRPGFFISIPRAVVFQPFFFSRYGCLLRTLDKLNPKNSKSSQNNCIAKFLGLFHPTSLLVFTYNILVLWGNVWERVAWEMKFYLRWVWIPKTVAYRNIVRIQLFDGIYTIISYTQQIDKKIEVFSLLPTLKRTNRPWKMVVGRLLSSWDGLFWDYLSCPCPLPSRS